MIILVLGRWKRTFAGRDEAAGMRFRRVVAVVVAMVLGLIGAMLIWSAIWFFWFHQVGISRSGSADGQFVPVPIIGFVAVYYFIRLGVVPATSIILALGAGALLLASVIFRRLR